MGDVRAKKYGADILACVQAVLQCDGLDSADFADFDAMLEAHAFGGGGGGSVVAAGRAAVGVARGVAPGAGAARPITLDSDDEDDIFSLPASQRSGQKRRRG